MNRINRKIQNGTPSSHSNIDPLEEGKRVLHQGRSTIMIKYQMSRISIHFYLVC